jgi:hypothetical protein
VHLRSGCKGRRNCALGAELRRLDGQRGQRDSDSIDDHHSRALL